MTRMRFLSVAFFSAMTQMYLLVPILPLKPRISNYDFHNHNIPINWWWIIAVSPHDPIISQLDPWAPRRIWIPKSWEATSAGCRPTWRNAFSGGKLPGASRAMVPGTRGVQQQNDIDGDPRWLFFCWVLYLCFYLCFYWRVAHIGMKCYSDVIGQIMIVGSSHWMLAAKPCKSCLDLCCSNAVLRVCVCVLFLSHDCAMCWSGCKLLRTDSELAARCPSLYILYLLPNGLSRTCLTFLHFLYVCPTSAKRLNWMILDSTYLSLFMLGSWYMSFVMCTTQWPPLLKNWNIFHS